jgi:GT2 family glycosyltransferase
MTAVIIPTLNPDTDMCRQAVQAVEETTSGVEIIVEHDQHRDGFAATCNAAANRTTADLLVFLNDDTVAQPGWLSELTPYADLGPTGAHLVYPDGSTQHAGVHFRRRQGVLEAYNWTRPAASSEVPAVTGACLAISRDWWDRLEGFDEAFVNGYEDVDLCLRARELGGTCWYVADSTVVHFESRSDPEVRFGHVAENIALLQERWGHLPV